ncbi:hypothetical protein N7489_007835 [Penicillium chrysogenum]|uniref:Methyltransferase domain-containing protein n=1 Tax=Penicillium chrysogenum TaxID=5076 RepID=A0ABQ8WB00_PENCH|nr:uncharacterized protein N7489_007835 [Penicillium chrysogenum]KAJ5237744.1 hypothetical protein N7489_007835 [Penicillium chrysogenum]KAJ5261996.1 hypothetical protein N7505_008863 [Penicillium chrysogenum]KAJ5278041.1 hypothetical protein N7524_004194 [Penicillium chrysogenum]KAJ6159925.1 hypothetical protein N7497_004462 [Penicillium chrysogenum]
MSRGDDYVLGRGIADSIRLDAQHLLWKLHRGYELHPRIPVTSDMKVAEIGTGTAIWIFDVTRQLPSTVQLHGFDISDSQFPPKDLWPQNVTLGLLDSLVDPPEPLVGQYDVVHLRMWATNVRESDASSLISHVKQILKPGGYIQWEDADLVHQVIKGDTAHELEQRLNEIFKRIGLDFNWVSNLPNLLRQDGLSILESDSGHFKPDLVQLCTNTYLLALREILLGIKRMLAQGLLLSVSEVEVALDRLCSTNTDGTIYNWSPISLLARKEG